MPTRCFHDARGRLRALIAAGLPLGLLALAFPPVGRAEVTTFGSSLSVPATLNTAEDLSYAGTNTAVPPSPEDPSGNVHTYHFGADVAIWSVSQAQGSPVVPATGQALRIGLEGCAVPAANGLPPLTQIHFQDVTPLTGGGVKINITSQAFSIPVCGAGGASGSTVSTYEPINLCVSQGDYVAFNDEGGFVEHAYQSGVPYRVLGSVSGSSSDSFIRGGGTNNGDSLPASDTSAMDGFASTRNAELLMQVTLGTHGDATHICPGGKRGLPPPLAPIRVSPQTDGVNHSRIVAVAMFCRVSPCNGVATLRNSRGHTYGRAGFSLIPNKTAHLPIRVKPELLSVIRRYHGVSATLTATVAGKTVTQTIGVKIF